MEKILDLRHRYREHKISRGVNKDDNIFMTKLSVAIWSDVYDDIEHLHMVRRWWHKAINKLWICRINNWGYK